MSSKNTIFSIPNIITYFRFVLIPVFVLTIFSGHSNSLLLSALILAFAGFTDILDGYIARKYNLITKWGQALDPLADKLMVITALVCITIKALVPLWAIVVIIFKELLMIIGGIFLYNKRHTVVPANRYGKVAAFILYVAIFASLLGLRYSMYLMIIAILLTVHAFIRYTLNFLQNERG